MPKFVLNEQESYNRAGRPGFGGRIYVKRQGRTPSGEAGDEVMLGTNLGGLKGGRIFGGVTNPIISSHHESPGGFTNSFPGLRDEGTFDFEAAFYPEELEWQRQASEFMRSYKGSPIVQHPVFGVNTPMLDCFFVLPRSTLTIAMCHGWLSNPGPYDVGPQENIMMASFSIKVNGEGYWVEPSVILTRNPDTVVIGTSPLSVDNDISLETVYATAEGAGVLEKDTIYLARLVLQDKYEIFSKPFLVPDPIDATQMDFGTVEQKALSDAWESGDSTKLLLYKYPYALWAA